MTAIHCGARPLTRGATVELNPEGPDRTVVLDATGIEAASDTDLLPVVRDLLAVAAYVFLADGAIRRDSPADPTAKGWRRELHLHVPVLEPERWRAAAPRLTTLLQFATDDTWSFEFRLATVDQQLRMGLVVPPDDEEPTCVALFSGGLDSLAGAVTLMDAGERPILASHWNTPNSRSVQEEVLAALRHARPGWRYPNPALRTIRAPGAGEAKDLTQRSRGVLYLSLAVGLAVQAGLRRVVVPENGVTSLNLAQSAQSVGAMRSRTTHPKTLALYRDLLHDLGLAVDVETPFADHTKADVITEIVTRAGEELAHIAVSCSHPVFQRKSQPHCGTCSQCVDRRLAGVAAGWDDAMEQAQHVTDLFCDPLEEGPATMYAEQYLRFAIETRDMTPDGMAQSADVWRAVALVEDPTAELMRIHGLVTRHARQVLDAYESVFKAKLSDLLGGRLPRTGLIRRIGTLEFRKEPWRRLADRLTDQITPAVRKGLGRKRPSTEHDVQTVIDIAQTAARSHLEREFPTVSFGQVGTRPDFSNSSSADERNEPQLFVEVKWIRERRQVRTATDEMLADIPKYARHGRSALFLVVDLDDFIPDEEAFAAPLERLGPIRVRVLR